MSRDREVRDIADELESLLDRLQVNVAELNAILMPPDGPAPHEPSAQPPEEVAS